VAIQFFVILISAIFVFVKQDDYPNLPD